MRRLAVIAAIIGACGCLNAVPQSEVVVRADTVALPQTGQKVVLVTLLKSLEAADSVAPAPSFAPESAVETVAVPAPPMAAAEAPDIRETPDTVSAVPAAEFIHDTLVVPVREKRPARIARPQFAWGVDLGSSVDLTGQDMTAIDLDANVGYSGPYLNFAGVGAAIRMAVSNSSRSYPVYALLRTSFTRNPSLCFLEARCGVSFNNYYNDISQRRLIAGAGIGVTLASGKTFSSHITLSYEFMQATRMDVGPMIPILRSIHSAAIRIGASF